MRPLGIITDSIDVTVVGVDHTLVNIYDGKFPTWEKYIFNKYFHWSIRFTLEITSVTKENNFVRNLTIGF